MSPKKNKKSSVRMERECAGYIDEPDETKRIQIISDFWDFIKGQVEYYRSPRHKPVSSKKLIKASKISRARSELHIDHRPRRHIFYLDTLDLAFRRAKVQLRLEGKYRPRKNNDGLTKSFNELTIKIGDKSDKRVEESLRINIEIWRKKGFAVAFAAACDADVRYIKTKVTKSKGLTKGEEAAKARRARLGELKHKLKEALSQATDEQFSEMKPYMLGHLTRNSDLVEFSPGDNPKDVLEIKTDDCDWETVLGETGAFAQLEIEHLSGAKKRRFSEMDKLSSRPDFQIVETTDSKEDPLMRTLEGYLLPADSSQDEQERVLANRQHLEEVLDPYRFSSCYKLRLQAA